MDRARATRLAVASMVVCLAAAGLGVVAGRRARAPEIAAGARPSRGAPGWLRKFVTRRFNPLVTRLGLVGGRRSPWAYLEHVGRHSGTVYRTPVLPTVVGDYAYVPLPYGEDVDWSRNVRAAGHCRLQRHGEVLELDEPVVIVAAERPGIPAWYRTYLERRQTRILRLHVLLAELGALAGTHEGASPRSAEPDGLDLTTTPGP